MSKGNILVTGGAGYIGSHVCAALRARGFTPVTLDNLGHGHREAVKYGPFAEGDIGDTALIGKICAQYKPLAALHFAALIEVGESVKQPDLYMQNNWEKARRLMESLRANDVTRVVFSSTAAVYGMPDREGPIAEDWPLKPINPYGESKLKAETFLRGQDAMESVILRYFNAAGAGADGLGEAHEPETHLVPNAILALLGLKPALTVFGEDYPTPDGTALRDYIHVLDLADAHVMALDHLLANKGSAAINLGTGTGASVKEVLAAVKAVAARDVPHSFGPRRPGDPPFLVADNKKARQILGWQPQRTLRDIIASALAWHRSPVYKKLITAHEGR
jgi:UDP-glucose 4-epimerase/UDP-arabinose 4-epimerase